ncbi:Ig-like domain repeat protein [Granulicella aggregans]|uniref:Ig-like domain repeat protein n=1 Tax=Granulicella aggregans TaxID=474949 RepID=UPI0021E0DB31|nr:Ig-like domain repeat protein [Granulicella aggregans]
MQKQFQFALAFLVLLAVQAVSLGQTSKGREGAAPRIAANIDDTNLVTLSGNIPPQANAKSDLGAAPEALPLEQMILVLKRDPAQDASLARYLGELQNPGSANYHRWLTPQAFGQRFGVAQQDIARIAAWLKAGGFTVESTPAGGDLIAFSGTHAQLKAAFHTEIHQYKTASGIYWSNAGDPRIPAALAPVVAGFASLNNFPRHAMHTKPILIKRDSTTGKWAMADVAKGKPQFTTTVKGETYYGVGPSDFATMYNVGPLWNDGIDGTGQTIAIIGESDINPADVDYFRSTFGLPAKKLNVIYPTTDPGTNGSEVEAALDVEWSGAVAKNATIDLVTAPNTNTTAGIDIAALYTVTNNLAPIVSESWGGCELSFGVSGNQFYSELWQQADAQGMTVMVSTGDSGSAGCDQDQEYASYGLQVNGISSTPYTVAVGGTDLYGDYTDPSAYWNASNDATTLASAKSYVPEAAWNNSCANDLLFGALQTEGVTDGDPLAVCNDATLQPYYVTTGGGSGGASQCTVSDGVTPGSCSGGNPKPTWQADVPGIPADGVRDLPDVSLFAGNGLWGSFYIYCQSDDIGTGACDVNTALQAAGGTSFASPAFAGIMALVSQQTGTQLGNPNYILYKLAAQQYADPSKQTACQSGNAAAAPGCTFYDVTQGGNMVPCLAGTANCTTTSSTQQFGILPGYETNVGYDLATGLGSINAYNLASSWSTAASTTLPTVTALSATGSKTAIYGESFPIEVSVSASASTQTPSGDVAVLSNTTVAGYQGLRDGTLVGGKVQLDVGGTPGGTYSLFGRYEGDATFAASESSGLQITITPAASATSVIASRTSLVEGQKVTLSSTVSSSIPSGASPTGTLTFSDLTTGKTIGTSPLVADSDGTSSSGYVTVASSSLAAGANSIFATYSGDGNYSSSTSVGAAVTLTAPFTVAVTPAALTVSVGSGTAGSAMVAVTPVLGATIHAAQLVFSCQGTLPPGLSCSFATPVSGSDGSATSTLSVTYQTPVESATQQQRTSPAFALGGLGVLGLLLMPRKRRSAVRLFVLLAVVCVVFSGLSGCSGGGGAAAPVATSTTLTSSSAMPTYGSTVTLTASVAASVGSSSPTGTVTFSDGGITLCTQTIQIGSASCSTKTLAIGKDAIVASYGGDAAHSPSASGALLVDTTLTKTISVVVSDESGNSSTTPLAVTLQ